RCDVPFMGCYRPPVRLAVEDCFLDPGVELDLAPKVEAVSDAIDVTQDIGLRAVALRPMPFLLQLPAEGIRVFQAFDVAAAPRIAVPVPGAANPGDSSECATRLSECAPSGHRVETSS